MISGVERSRGRSEDCRLIDPVRILDTRTDVGLAGPFVSAVSQKLQVTGGAVPAGATGVLLNVTVASPMADGFVSVRPGDATGAPTTSSLNFTAGTPAWANAVQVGLANAGKIDITYDAYGKPGPTTEVLIDVVGYMVGTTPSPPPKLSDYTIVDIEFDLDPSSRSVGKAVCPLPLEVLGGGFSYADGVNIGAVIDDVVLLGSTITSGSPGWEVDFYNFGSDSPTVMVTAICAR